MREDPVYDQYAFQGHEDFVGNDDDNAFVLEQQDKYVPEITTIAPIAVQELNPVEQHVGTRTPSTKDIITPLLQKVGIQSDAEIINNKIDRMLADGSKQN